MASWSRGFGYLAALALVTTGFMFGSCVLFAVIIWVLAWVPVVFWMLSPFLAFMAVLELVIFTMTMNQIQRGGLVTRWSLLGAWQILLSSLWMSVRIWQLAYTLISIFVPALVVARHRSRLSGAAVAYRLSMKPIREQISRQFIGFCH